MRKIRLLILPFALMLAACGNNTSPSESPGEARVAEPPPLPTDRENADFASERDAKEAVSSQPSSAANRDDAASQSAYWGVAPGEPLPVQWQDLMPEGAQEELNRQQDKFVEMLEKRYAANSTSLADVDPYAEITEGSEFDYMPQLGTFDVVEELDGELIRIPGYVVPFDFNTKSQHSEFLFVPYMGACIHSPPPPPNQVIFVTADPPQRVEDIWAPYWLEGTLSTNKHEHEVADAAYSLALKQLEPYTD